MAFQQKENKDIFDKIKNVFTVALFKTTHITDAEKKLKEKFLKWQLIAVELEIQQES